MAEEINMLYEKVKELKNKNPEKPCAVLMAEAINTIYHLELDQNSINLMYGLSFGLGYGGMCGCYMACLSLSNIVLNSFENINVRKRQLEIIKLLNDKMGDFNCSILRQKYAVNGNCIYILEECSKIFENFIYTKGAKI